MITSFWLAFAVLFLPFYAEVLLAAIFAFAMEPTLGRLLQKRHMKWRTSVAVILTAMFVALAIPITVVCYKLYAYVVEISKTGFQNTTFYQKILGLKDKLIELANNLMTRFGFSESPDLSSLGSESLGQAANTILTFLTAFVYKVPSILLSLFVFCAALYFFLAEAGPLKRVFQRQKVLSPVESKRFIEILQKSSFNTVVSSVVIAAMQATIVSIGALILGSGDFTVVWVVTFFCSFIPVIGAGPVALALAVGDLLMGQYGTAVGFVVVAVIAGTMDNLARPYLIASGDEDMHPVVSLLAIIGALILFGMPGLFLGPVIASVAFKIIPALQNEPEPAVTASGKDPV
ncbi:MAG: AI-2E family transporter [Bdellovibrionales bacterium]|nr:AI-2E family transporter [Bdellovibrionales bacterium]